MVLIHKVNESVTKYCTCLLYLWPEQSSRLTLRSCGLEDSKKYVKVQKEYFAQNLKLNVWRVCQTWLTNQNILLTSSANAFVVLLALTTFYFLLSNGPYIRIFAVFNVHKNERLLLIY